MTFSFFAILSTIDLLGVNRGETIRLWIFLAVFLQMLAAYVCTQRAPFVTCAVVLTMTVLQSMFTVGRIGFVVPY